MNIGKIPGFTAFNREPNLRALAENASELPRDHNGSLQIADVGCSSFEEPLSLGAMLLKNGIEDFRIRAMDLDRDNLRAGAGFIQYGYLSSETAIDRMKENGILDFFDVSDRSIRPIPELAERIRPSHKDILRAPLEKGAYGAVVCNWMINYYVLPYDQYRIVRNLSHGVALGGLLVTREVAAISDYLQSEGDLRLQFKSIDGLSGNRNKIPLFRKIGLDSLVKFANTRNMPETLPVN